MSKTTDSLIARLNTAATALKGKRGAPEARALADRVTEAARRHARNLTPRQHARSPEQIERGRATRAANLADAANGYPLAAFGRSPFAERWPLRRIADLVGAGAREIAKVGGWWISTEQIETKDWDFYSKAWHRSHGPKVTVESRTIQIRRFVDGKIESRDQKVDGWRGNWALNALIAAGVVEPVKVPTRLRPVQMHPAFSVDLYRHHGDFAVYRHTLAGETHDFCSLWHGLTFHASTPRAAFRGLREKIAAAEKRRNGPIDWASCKALGFCDEGIRQFCRDFDLDPKGSYRPDEIRIAVETDIDRAAPYASELKTLARSVGYEIPSHLA